MGGAVVIPLVCGIAALLVAAYLIGDSEIERYKAERDVRTLARNEAARRSAREAAVQRRLSQQRSRP